MLNLITKSQRPPLPEGATGSFVSVTKCAKSDDVIFKFALSDALAAAYYRRNWRVQLPTYQTTIRYHDEVALQRRVYGFASHLDTQEESTASVDTREPGSETPAVVNMMDTTETSESESNQGLNVGLVTALPAPGAVDLNPSVQRRTPEGGKDKTPVAVERLPAAEPPVSLPSSTSPEASSHPPTPEQVKAQTDQMREALRAGGSRHKDKKTSPKADNQHISPKSKTSRSSSAKGGARSKR